MQWKLDSYAILARAQYFQVRQEYCFVVKPQQKKKSGEKKQIKILSHPPERKGETEAESVFFLL